MPIFVRPVREQLEHDRLIRFLQAKYKRKSEVALNVGDEQAAPVKLGTATFFPDLVLTTDGKKLAGLVEVESGESVNNLEAMAQWVHFSKARVPFHLYVPVQSFEVARRLCEAYGAKVSELWTYRPTHEGFDLVRMIHDPSLAKAAAASPAPSGPSGARKPAAKKAPVKAVPAKGEAARPLRKPERPAPSKKAAKPAARKAPGKKAPAKARPAAKAKKPARRK